MSGPNAGSGGLRRFTASQAAQVSQPAQASQPAQPAQPAEEKCELCATVIPSVHGHIADLESASLVCACRACYLLFTNSEAGHGKYRAIPDRYLIDPEHPISAAEWDTLDVPVGLAFFLRDSARNQVTGFYPSPAGATECRLDLPAWQQLAVEHPLLDAAEADVEAVLLWRSDTGVDCFVVPIDACYELAGRMRLTWRGFDGGSEARASIAEFLGDVRTRARALKPRALNPVSPSEA